jgi:hypothetical protein
MSVPDRAAPTPDPWGMDADIRPAAAEAAGSLRAVIAAVDAGELDADEVTRAYLAGAADALAAVAEDAAPSTLR